MRLILCFLAAEIRTSAVLCIRRINCAGLLHQKYGPKEE